MMGRSAGIFALGCVLAAAVRQGHRHLSALNGHAAFWALDGESASTKAECGDSTWGDVTPPSAGARIGAYTLVQCLGSGAEGEAWKAQLEGEDDKFFAVKIMKTPSEALKTSLLYECLFSQLATHRDEAHFVDCLAVGAQSLGATVHNYMVMEVVPGKTLMHYMFAVDNKFKKSLVPLVSLWMQLADAYEAMYKTSDADAFKLIDYDVHPANIMVDFTVGSEEPSVKIADYGRSRICCLGGEPDSCRASLRPGTIDGQLPLPAAQTFKMCSEEAFRSSSRLAKNQALGLAQVVALVFDEEAMIRLQGTMDKPDYNKALALVAKEPLGYLGAELTKELSIADETAEGVKQRFDEVLKMMMGMLQEHDEAQAIKTCLPAALPGKLRELHSLLTASL